jgi:hypothetical protein
MACSGGFLFATPFISSSISAQAFKTEVQTYLFAGFIFTFFCSFPTTVLMKEKPDNPPR